MNVLLWNWNDFLITNIVLTSTITLIFWGNWGSGKLSTFSQSPRAIGDHRRLLDSGLSLIPILIPLHQDQDEWEWRITWWLSWAFKYFFYIFKIFYNNMHLLIEEIYFLKHIKHAHLNVLLLNTENLSIY